MHKGEPAVSDKPRESFDRGGREGRSPTPHTVIHSYANVNFFIKVTQFDGDLIPRHQERQSVGRFAAQRSMYTRDDSSAMNIVWGG